MAACLVHRAARLFHRAIGIGLIAACSLVGCTAVDKTPFSQSITASGAASIEQTHRGSGIGFGVIKTQVLILEIDRAFQSVRGHGVFPLKPGHHEIRVAAQFHRMAVSRVDLVIDAAEVVLPLDAAGGCRYRVMAKELDLTTGEAWIEEVVTGREVVPRVRLDLNGTPQHIPLVVPIPVG